MKITKLDEKNYEEEVLKSKRPVVAYFSASWCKFCAIMEPRFDRIVDDFKGEVKFCKVDIDKNKKLADKNNLKGVPCIILYKDGTEIGRIVGVEEQDVLLDKIESHLADYS